MIMGHVGDTAFLAQAKGPVLPGHMGDTAFLLVQKTHITTLEHLAVLPLTPHKISNRQTCQKEKFMINRSALGLIWVSRVDMGYDMKICHTIISIYKKLL